MFWISAHCLVIFEMPRFFDFFPFPPPDSPPPDRRKFRAFFTLSHLHFRSFSLSGSLLVEFWWCFWRPGPLNVHVWSSRAVVWTPCGLWGISCQYCFFLKKNSLFFFLLGFFFFWKMFLTFFQVGQVWGEGGGRLPPPPNPNPTPWNRCRRQLVRLPPFGWCSVHPSPLVCGAASSLKCGASPLLWCCFLIPPPSGCCRSPSSLSPTLSVFHIQFVEDVTVFSMLQEVFSHEESEWYVLLNGQHLQWKTCQSLRCCARVLQELLVVTWWSTCDRQHVAPANSNVGVESADPAVNLYLCGNWKPWADSEHFRCTWFRATRLRSCLDSAWSESLVSLSMAHARIVTALVFHRRIPLTVVPWTLGYLSDKAELVETATETNRIWHGSANLCKHRHSIQSSLNTRRPQWVMMVPKWKRERDGLNFSQPASWIGLCGTDSTSKLWSSTWFASARIDLALVSPTSSTCRLSGSVTEIVVDVEQCKKIVMEVPWVRRSVRPSAVLFDVFRHLHRTWVPFCAWEGKANEGMLSDGGWRLVTTARTVFDVLAGRSCNVLHFHRTRSNPCSVCCFGGRQWSKSDSEVVADNSHSRPGPSIGFGTAPVCTTIYVKCMGAPTRHVPGGKELRKTWQGESWRTLTTEPFMRPNLIQKTIPRSGSCVRGWLDDCCRRRQCWWTPRTGWRESAPRVWTMGARDVHNAEPSARSRERCSLSCATCPEPLVLLDLPSARRKQLGESSNARVVAFGIRWRCLVLRCWMQTNSLAVFWCELRHRCENISAKALGWLVGLLQAGRVVVKDHHKVGIWLESQTPCSWSKRNA